jgi:hypothetical protein
MNADAVAQSTSIFLVFRTQFSAPSAHWLRSGPFVKLGTSGDKLYLS